MLRSHHPTLTQVQCAYRRATSVAWSQHAPGLGTTGKGGGAWTSVYGGFKGVLIKSRFPSASLVLLVSLWSSESYNSHLIQLLVLKRPLCSHKHTKLPPTDWGVFSASPEPQLQSYLETLVQFIKYQLNDPQVEKTGR